MLSLYTLVASSQAVADTLHKEILAKKIETLSQMSAEELTSMAVKWVLSLSARVLIALAIFFIGRWIIRYLKKIVRRMMERRAVDPSLKSFLLNLISITLTLFLIIVIIGILGIDTTLDLLFAFDEWSFEFELTDVAVFFEDSLAVAKLVLSEVWFDSGDLDVTLVSAKETAVDHTTFREDFDVIVAV